MECISLSNKPEIEMKTPEVESKCGAEKEEERREEAEDCAEERSPLGPTDPHRPDSPASTASTSGVCSMASEDFDSSEDIPQLKNQTKSPEHPVITYEKRNILNVFENIYPFSIYQSTYVPKMNMSNYWERRSVYHRLGPFGRLDELHYKKCSYCDFHTTVPKVL